MVTPVFTGDGIPLGLRESKPQGYNAFVQIMVRGLGEKGVEVVIKFEIRLWWSVWLKKGGRRRAAG